MSSEVMPEQKSWAETPPLNPPIRHVIGEFVESQTWLDQLGEPIQNWLLAFFGQPGQPNRCDPRTRSAADLLLPAAHSTIARSPGEGEPGQVS